MYIEKDGDDLTMNCRLCGSNELRECSVESLYECSKCTFVQRSDEYTPIEDSINQERFRKTSSLDMEGNNKHELPDLIRPLYHVYLEDFRRINTFLKKFIESNFFGNGSIDFIDVGSGTGFMSFKLKESNPILNMHLMEINKQKMDVGIDAFNPDLKEFIFYNEYLEIPFVEKNRETFDITFSFHVLEHVENGISFMKSLYDITKKGGCVIVEVPNQDDDLIKLSSEYDKIIHFPSHVSNFTKKTLSLLLDKCGISGNEVEFIPIQRYGFFNYIDWIRFGTKEKILSDDYIPRDDVSWIEKKWLEHKKDNFTTDSIMMIIKK